MILCPHLCPSVTQMKVPRVSTLPPFHPFALRVIRPASFDLVQFPYFPSFPMGCYYPLIFALFSPCFHKIQPCLALPALPAALVILQGCKVHFLFCPWLSNPLSLAMLGPCGFFSSDAVVSILVIHQGLIYGASRAKRESSHSMNWKTRTPSQWAVIDSHHLWIRNERGYRTHLPQFTLTLHLVHPIIGLFFPHYCH